MPPNPMMPSASIESSMASLAVSPPTTTRARGPYDNPNIPNQINPPRPAHTPYTKDRFWIYGIEMPDSEILELYNTYRERLGARWDPDADDVMRYISVCNILKAMTGIHGITVDRCFPQGTVPTAENPRNRVGDARVSVVTVFNSTKYSYYYRPSQDRVDRLQTILKRGPAAWYLDSKTKDYY
ncbi:hypothetical protein H0H93_008721 [Arthromyces matolae]|nr:hypothetical protein H0H93_008721 [Arthromyces matolae]